MEKASHTLPARTALHFENSFNVENDRAAAKPLEVYALVMIKNFADQNPTLTHKWEGNGQEWTMKLHFKPSFKEPVLEVALPFGVNNKKHFRPLTQESWRAFVRCLKTESEATIAAMQARIPELTMVNFKQKVVPCPRSISSRTEPILISCSQYGLFDGELLPFSQFLDDYYPQTQPELAQTQPTESSHN